VCLTFHISFITYTINRMAAFCLIWGLQMSTWFPPKRNFTLEIILNLWVTTQSASSCRFHKSESLFYVQRRMTSTKFFHTSLRKYYSDLKPFSRHAPTVHPIWHVSLWIRSLRPTGLDDCRDPPEIFTGYLHLTHANNFEELSKFTYALFC